MLFDDFTTVGVRAADRAVVRTLRTGVALRREARRTIGFGVPQEVLLLEPEPEIFVVTVEDRRTAIRLVRRTVGVENLCHDEKGIPTAGIREDGNGPSAGSQKHCRRPARSSFRRRTTSGSPRACPRNPTRRESCCEGSGSACIHPTRCIPTSFCSSRDSLLNRLQSSLDRRVQVEKAAFVQPSPSPQHVARRKPPLIVWNRPQIRNIRAREGARNHRCLGREFNSHAHRLVTLPTEIWAPARPAGHPRDDFARFSPLIGRLERPQVGEKAATTGRIRTLRVPRAEQDPRPWPQ